MHVDRPPRRLVCVFFRIRVRPLLFSLGGAFHLERAARWNGRATAAWDGQIRGAGALAAPFERPSPLASGDRLLTEEEVGCCDG